MSEETPTPEVMPEVSSDDRLWAALSYIFTPIIPIILLLLEDKKNKPFIKYHAVQSLIVGIVFWIIIGILAVPTFGCAGLLWLVFFYFAYKAYQGEYLEIPVITNFMKGQGWA
jgi:uncharacterized membrane protein